VNELAATCRAIVLDFAEPTSCFSRPSTASQSGFRRPSLLILLKRRPLFAFEFEGRRLDIGTKQDWMRANLILGLEQEPWRSTIEDVIAEHPEGRRIARRVAAGKPTKTRAKK